MKKFIFLIVSLFVCVLAFSQEPAQTSVENFSISVITDSIKLLISYINWLYVIVFMLVAWLINDTSEATNTASFLSWFGKVNKALRALIIGVFIIIVFAWVFHITKRTEIFKLLLSLLMAMVVYKFGIDKSFRWISQKFGLKFE